MCEVLMEIMKKDIDKKVAEGLMKVEAKGRMEGRMEGVIETLLNLVRKGLISEERAAEEAHMSVSQFREQARLA